MNTKPTAAQLVRILVKVKGDRTWVYNDKLRTGRSIKVCGWKRKDAELAKAVLETHGYKVKIRTILGERKVHRLHVTNG
jgi:hypothetical protein